MMDKTLVDAMEDYYEMRSGALAKSTWSAHERQLEKFANWVMKPSELGPQCLLVDVTDKVMTQYFNRVRFQVSSGSTFNNYRQYLKSFWDFCLGEAWVPRNPMRHVKAAPVTRRPRLQLSAQELLQALETAEPRDRIGLAIGMNTGLRAGDIATLKVGDVNLSNNMLHAFIEKTDTYDDIPMTAELAEEMVRWFAHYAAKMGLTDWRRQLPNEWTLVPPMDWLAVNVWKPELGGNTRYKVTGTYAHIWEIPQRALARLGHPTKGEGFHTIRRSTARRFYELAKSEGIEDPIRISQALLGHKNQHTTEIYLGMEPDKRRRDDLMRGRSFLRKVAADEVRTARGGDDEGGLAAVNDR